MWSDEAGEPETSRTRNFLSFKVADGETLKIRAYQDLSDKLDLVLVSTSAKESRMRVAARQQKNEVGRCVSV